MGGVGVSVCACVCKWVWRVEVTSDGYTRRCQPADEHVWSGVGHVNMRRRVSLWRGRRGSPVSAAGIWKIPGKQERWEAKIFDRPGGWHGQ